MAAVLSVAPDQEIRDGLPELTEFRERVYACLSVRRDALFGVLDAVCCPVVVQSLAHLSLAERHGRRHGSVYGALARGRIDADRLREELIRARDRCWPLVFAVDTSTWCRCDAECSAGRGYYYHPSRHSAGQPIVAGWRYQWIAQLGWAADSWTAPMDAVRLDPRCEAPGPERAAAGQIRDLLGRLGPTGAVPWFVFDGGYDPVQLSVECGDARAQLLTRVKSSRVFHPADSESSTGTRRFSAASPAPRCYVPSAGLAITEHR
ncbi:hypothetical protein DIZ27_40205 [Streptomyces sp. NWU339]|uniref:transposase n=1 Tax=Streptomyces sp. NWU339 TaxID=2185284 RepID=UPI000D68011E|nr:transposase [Streptomyces sp. NWU339]PWI05274.1 hypothetical protein DIZ27_40205 [Streptomyces sp. NWU339]